jgi:hypothetical protein
MPKFYTHLEIRGKNISQNIAIDLACDRYPNESTKNEAERLKQFIVIIKKIINSRDEVKKIPKTWGYLLYL